MNLPSPAVICLVLLLCFTHVIDVSSQSSDQEQSNVTLPTDTAIVDSVRTVQQDSTVDMFVTSGSISIQNSDFNRGDISDPLLLIAGLAPSVQVYNRGGNPNTPAYLRVRGITTYNPAVQPLIVIDGLVDGSFDLVDPNDIESIKIHKEAAMTSLYGGRGSAGVIEITTKAAAQEGLHFSYQGQRAQAKVSRTIPLLDRQAFLDRGGFDFGSSTDWLESISQIGSSDNHHLTTSYLKDNVNIRASTNYRSNIGVLRGSGSKSLSSRVNFDVSFLDDRLRLSARGAVRTADADNGFEEAVRAALTYNPTAPITGDDPALPFELMVSGLEDTLNYWVCLMHLIPEQ